MRYMKNRGDGVRYDTMKSCRLCGTVGQHQPVRGADMRSYLHCDECAVITVDEKHFLSADRERARYQEHNNGAHNQGHVDFLQRVIRPLRAYVSPPMRGLDYGSGPVATASVLLKREGLECDDYDPFFYPERPVAPYDFILSTETFEHFFAPRKEIGYLTSILRPEGILAIMTEVWDSVERFASWYYARDPSHVTFYSRQSIGYICASFGFRQLYTDSKRVFILQKVS
jgi:SAM-dependent methyltransferase